MFCDAEAELEAIRQKVRESQDVDQLRQWVSTLITLLMDMERDRKAART